MIDSHAFDGLVMALVGIGILVGAIAMGIGFWAVPWLFHHLSIRWA